MTRFNPKQLHRDALQWSKIAYQTADNDRSAETLVLGLVLGIGVASFSTPLLGFAVGGYFALKGMKRAYHADKNKKYIKDTGCVAHVLCGSDFRAYLDQNGRDQVLAELLFASSENLEFSPDASDYWELERETNSQAIESGDDNQSTPESVQVGEIDIIAELTDRIQNIAGIGLGGSGKGMLIANACRAVKAKHPGKKIFLINGKDDPREYGYFQGIVDEERRLHCETAKPQTVAAWFESAIADYDKYVQGNNGALLIIDEGTIIGARLQAAKSTALNDKIIGITSSGNSTGKRIWVFYQTPFVGGNGSNLSANSPLISLVIVRSDSIGVLEQWRRSSLFKKFSSSEVEELAKKSECDRAVYWGGSATWYPMPKLENYSAYDRDTETYLKVTDKIQVELEDVETKIDDDLIECIFDKIAGSLGITSFEAIRSHLKRQKPEIAKTDIIDRALYELKQQGLIDGDKSSGYRIS